MSKSELCRHLMRAYLMWARELQKQELSYTWLLRQIKDINRMRLHFKYVEECETREYVWRNAA